MVVHKRKRNTRMRGAKTTHGYGSKKKHRGAGHRGGVGMAGTGKRADQKKPSILKEFGNAYYGKHGFHRPSKVIDKLKGINLGQIDLHFDNYLAQNFVIKEGNTYMLDVAALGYQKVLGTGSLTHKVKIKARAFSASAVEKITAAGGEALTA